MFERGMEHGTGTPGLGLIKGDVELLDADVVPHMGWDTVEAPEGSVLMKGVEGERFYFVHSFAAMSAAPADTSGDQLDFGDAEERVTWCTYGRSRFVAAYERGPLFATQQIDKSKELVEQIKLEATERIRANAISQHFFRAFWTCIFRNTKVTLTNTVLTYITDIRHFEI